MIDPDALNVWHEQRLVGYLWRNSINAIGFRYDTDWIVGGGFAVSRSLPLALNFCFLIPGSNMRQIHRIQHHV